MDDKNKVEAVINGKVYKLVGLESEEYIQSVARYIDRKLLSINKSSSSQALSADYTTILLAINIADDLFKEKEIVKNIEADLKKERQTVKNMADDLKKEKDASKKLQKETADLNSKLLKSEKELKTARKELSEYIETFENKENKGSVN